MRLVLVVALALFGCAASATGLIVGSSGEGYVSYERTAVSQRYGSETLIVESTVHAPPGRYVWIVPVPSRPSEFHVCTPGTMESVTRVMLPPLERTNLADIDCVLVSLLFMAVLPRLAFRVLSGKTQKRRFHIACFVSLALAFATGGILEILMSPEDPGRERPYRYEPWELGQANLAGLAVGSPTEIETWTTNQGFHLTEQERKLIASEAAKGWCFLVANVDIATGAQTVLSPVQVVFPAAKLVAPMELTGAQGKPFDEDLVVLDSVSAFVP